MIGFILRRIALALAAASMLAAAAGVLVVALAFSLYALLKPWFGQAGAAAAVAGAAALLIALGAAIMLLMSRPSRSKKLPTTAKGVVNQAVEFLREKPVVAISAALGAGFMMVRNPRYLGAAVRSFIEGRELPRRRNGWN